MPLTPDVYAAITQMAEANGIDPAYALAIAQRESSFNVRGGSGSPYSSAYGLFQLLRGERARFGGSSSDPYEQANAWGDYIQDTRNTMARVLGRDPTGSELYLGHYFGPARAARMVAGTISPDTSVSDVFSWKELAANPNIVRAGTVGRLTSSIQGDIDRRATNFGADPSQMQQYASYHPADLSSYGTLVGKPADLSSYGTLVGPHGIASDASQPVDLSGFGTPVSGQPQASAPVTPDQSPADTDTSAAATS